MQLEVRWRRWTGLVSALCLLGFAGILVAVALDPAFWAGGGGDLRLLLVLMVFALIANLCLRRTFATFTGKPAITVQAKGLHFSDGLSQRFLPWGDIERLRLTRSRLIVDLAASTEGRGAWLLMAQLGVAPALRYLYIAVDLDKRGFYSAVRDRAPDHLRFELAS